ncbi:hypothetical protein [Microbacterium sp. DT81.1]
MKARALGVRRIPLAERPRRFAGGRYGGPGDWLREAGRRFARGLG